MPDLKLIALDSEDLEVISAHLQDAVVRVGDMGMSSADKRFALLLNRYVWEQAGGRRAKGQRKRVGLHFDNVLSAKVTGIDQNARDGVLELLSILFEPGEEPPSGTVVLAFAGGGTVRLDVECLEARMQDLGAAWAAKGRPEHALDE